MKRDPILVFAVVLGLTLASFAGDISGKIAGGKGKSVVWVEAPAGKTYPAPSAKLVMDQKGLVFSPHVMVVQQGATVDFLNSDKVQHNVYWPSISGNKKLTHNLGTWPQGEKRGFKFDNPGVVTLLCNVHPEMSAYIIVSPTPYFAETDNDGEYKLTNVPAGDYKLTAWHEGMKQQTKDVKVAGAAKADFALTK
jgi:plastocyanin